MGPLVVARRLARRPHARPAGVTAFFRPLTEIEVLEQAGHDRVSAVKDNIGQSQVQPRLYGIGTSVACPFPV